MSLPLQSIGSSSSPYSPASQGSTVEQPLNIRPHKYTPRGRGNITDNDVMQLEIHFIENPFPINARKTEIAKSLGLTHRSVVEWFKAKQDILERDHPVSDIEYVYPGARRGRAMSQSSSTPRRVSGSGMYAGHLPNTPAGCMPPLQPVFDLPGLNLSTFTDVYGGSSRNLPGDFRDRVHMAAGMSLPVSPMQTPIVPAAEAQRKCGALKRPHAEVDIEGSPLQAHQNAAVHSSKKKAVPFNLPINPLTKRTSTEEGDALLAQYIDLPSSTLSPRCSNSEVAPGIQSAANDGNFVSRNSCMYVPSIENSVDASPDATNASHAAPDINDDFIDYIANFL